MEGGGGGHRKALVFSVVLVSNLNGCRSNGAEAAFPLL